ncbi:hypothetical protein GDO78_001797 [Eleutherodactylus coqui]|uniref:Uncharacterized protein n=1 Tax=Eleutherodactylus coqui TaxID=57060 RepID=A0A8J6FVA1_ELECQ|nr:hypothetical protein GDO78_001797 [Eleutherodactylus coqui]
MSEWSRLQDKSDDCMMTIGQMDAPTDGRRALYMQVLPPIRQCSHILSFQRGTVIFTHFVRTGTILEDDPILQNKGQFPIVGFS